MRAYEEMIRNTSTKRAPWYVVPADHKWFTRVVVAEALVHALYKLDLSLPQLDAEKRKDLKKARAILKDTKEISQDLPATLTQSRFGHGKYNFAGHAGISYPRQRLSSEPTHRRHRNWSGAGGDRDGDCRESERAPNDYF